MSIWVDGVRGHLDRRVGGPSAPPPIPWTSPGYCDGNYPNGGDTHYIWHGTIDEARFYTRALSSTISHSLYNNGGACGYPTGKEGDMMYNSDYHVMQYCDGTYWQPMGKVGGDIASGLAAYWKFDESSGTNAADSSGNGHNATLNGGMTLQPAGGKIAGAVLADGSTGYVQTPSIDLSGTQALTVSMWVNRTYGGSLATLIESNTNFNNAGNRFAMFFDDTADCGVSSAISINSKDNGGAYNSKCYTEPSSGVWHMLTAVFDYTQATPSQVSFYIDGVAQNTRQLDKPGATAPAVTSATTRCT